MEQALFVITNVPDVDVANVLANELVTRRLAACVTILPAVKSVYRWQGAVEVAHEIPLFIKTSRQRYSELEDSVRALHPYDVPEIIALPIAAGLPSYLDWITKETEKDVHT